MLRLIVVLLAVALAGWFLSARGASSTADVDEISDALAPLAFLTGAWQGTMGENDFVEEVWSEASGGGMMGMFRWLNPEGRPRMYELLTLSTEGQDVLLRLRHFTAEMVAWEERDSPVVLRLAETKPGRATFVNRNETAALERIVFFTTEEGRLGIDVLFQADSSRSDLNFRLKRR